MSRIVQYTDKQELTASSLLQMRHFLDEEQQIRILAHKDTSEIMQESGTVSISIACLRVLQLLHSNFNKKDIGRK
jgi:hypothetical protein